MKRYSTAIVLVLAMLATPALAQSGHEGHGTAANAPASTKAFEEAHATMMKDMGKPLTGNTDVDFVEGMIPHHQGAIDMAKIQLQYGKAPELRKLAQKIIADQEKEIAEMQAWLKKNKK
jgi:uncharacterized protein (DUF305 family)